MKQQTTIKPQELTSIRALASEMNIVQTTLYRWILRTPTIKTYRIGQILAVSKKQVQEELQKQPKQPKWYKSEIASPGLARSATKRKKRIIS